MIFAISNNSTAAIFYVTQIIDATHFRRMLPIFAILLRFFIKFTFLQFFNHNLNVQKFTPLKNSQFPSFRLKTTPRPRITPSWVHDKVQSSMSVCSEDESDSSSSVDPNEFKQGVNTNAIPPSRRHHYRPRAVSNKEPSISKHSSASSTGGRSETNLQRYVLGSRNRITDTGKSSSNNGGFIAYFSSKFSLFLINKGYLRNLGEECEQKILRFQGGVYREMLIFG